MQFKLDGVPLGAEDTTAPYSTIWNTTTATNGSHTLTAIARDAAGNTTTSVGRVVTVNNAYPAPIATPPHTVPYTSAQNVVLTAPGSSIRYTTTTTNPTCTTGTIYTTPIHITVSTTIKAIACYGTSPVHPSAVASFIYTITAPSTPGTYGTTIVVKPSLTSDIGRAVLAPAVVDLKKYLDQMTGLTYTTTSAEVSTSHIALMLADDSSAPAVARAQLLNKGVEAFVIVGDATKLQIIANAEKGLSDGIYFYLERLGVRWLMSGDNWIIVPPRSNVTININELEVPSFYHRMYAGVGGFSSYVSFGSWANPSGTMRWGNSDDGWNTFKTDTQNWQRRMRYSSVYTLGKDIGQAVIKNNLLTFKQHPEYLAKITYDPHLPLEPRPMHRTPLFRKPFNTLPVGCRVNCSGGAYELPNPRLPWNLATNDYRIAVPARSGTHDLNTIAKLDPSNPAAVELFCSSALNLYRGLWIAQGSSAIHRISVNPSDGFGYAQNYTELENYFESQMPGYIARRGLARRGQSNISDQVFFVANKCADTLKVEFPDIQVVVLSYSEHTDPPTFPLKSNVIVQMSYQFRQNTETESLTDAELTDRWAGHPMDPVTARLKLAVYPTFGEADWFNEEPVFDYLKMVNDIHYWNNNNMRGMSSESTYGMGIMGLGHYISAHIMWDMDMASNNAGTLIDEWYRLAFGPARVPMERMIKRWATSYLPISAELGWSYRDIQEAQTRAVGNPAVIARIDDYAGYLHYLRLRTEFQNLTVIPSNLGERQTKMITLAKHLLNINDSHMVHASRMLDLHARPLQYPILFPTFSLANLANPGIGWQGVHKLSHAEVANLITSGRNAYPVSVVSDFTARQFTGTMTRVTPTAWTEPPASDRWGPTMKVVGNVEADLQIPAGLNALHLRVSRLVDNNIQIRNAAGTLVDNRVHTVTKVTADGLNTWQELNIPLAPGRYKIRFAPAGSRAFGRFNFQMWKGTPLTMTSFLAQVPERLYFYVPQGLQKAVIYFPLGYQRNVSTRVYKPDGTVATIEGRDHACLIKNPSLAK